jgi:predicted esterase
VKRLFDSPSGRCVLHTWGGNGWQFNELTVFGHDTYAVLDDMCGGVGAEPLNLFIARLTGLSAAEAEDIATEMTARWRDSGEEAE